MNATRHTSRLLVGLVVAAAALGFAAPRADAATTASFGNGVLSVFGDAQSNSIAVSRNAAGQLLVNGASRPARKASRFSESDGSRPRAALSWTWRPEYPRCSFYVVPRDSRP